jgi:hypothetical protein
MPEKLLYECSPRPFFVPPRVVGHRERFGRLDVIEYRRRSKVQPYGLRMESEVSTKEEAKSSHSEALQLARDLNNIWTYIAVVPLFPRRLFLKVADSPPGWRTNFRKLESTLPSGQRLHFKIAIGPTISRYEIGLRFMPLQRALDAVRTYRAANENVRALIDLHVDAKNHLGSQSELFLLAKALELARFMLPGRTDPQHQAALPPAVRSELRQSVHWLFDIANHRLEIRHVVSRRTLLPKLSPTERSDFVHDADLVIRGVVEKELGIEAVIATTK